MDTSTSSQNTTRTFDSNVESALDETSLLGAFNRSRQQRQQAKSEWYSSNVPIFSELSHSFLAKPDLVISSKTTTEPITDNEAIAKYRTTESMEKPLKNKLSSEHQKS